MKKKINEFISLFQSYIDLQNQDKNKQEKSSPFSSNASSVSARSSPISTPRDLESSELDPLAKFIENSSQSTFRQQYEQRLRKETNLDILNEQHLLAIATFIKNNINLIRELLNADSASSAPLHIGKKIEQRDPRFVGRLPRTIEIDRNTLKIYVLPSRKMSSGLKVESRARSGSYKKVTDRILINPMTEMEVLTGSVTKRQVLGSEADRVMREIKLEARVYGNEGMGIGEEYLSKKKLIVRTTDTKALDSLDKLTNPYTAEDILRKDKDYDETPEAKNIILLRLVSDILECMGKVHNAGIIHNDIKGENMLVYLDENQNLRAKIIDFGLSVDITGEIPANTMQPVATCTHASPEVVAFVRCRINAQPQLPVFYSSLYDNFSKQTYYGYEKYKQGQSAGFTNTQYEQFMNNRCDIKDDMWAVGVTLYALITGAYPTDHKHLDGNYVFSDLRYMHIDTALMKFPLLAQLKPLIIDGLLSPTRESRPDAATAQKLLQQLVGQDVQKRKLF